MTLTPAQAVAQVDSPRHDWDELSDHYKRHCREIAAAAIAAHKVLEADVPLAPPECMPPAADEWEAYYAPPAPSFHPERDGNPDELVAGDRVLWGGVWREVAAAESRLAGCHVRFVVGSGQYVGAATLLHTKRVRIQKRATVAEGPPAEMRLPSGDVAYQTIRAGEVVPGMWVEVDDAWRQVTTTSPRKPNQALLQFDDHPWWMGSADRKVKVASTVDGARLAAERQAQRAEAYDTACEART